MNDMTLTKVGALSAPTMTTREIAEMVGKRHDNVLQDAVKDLQAIEDKLFLKFQGYYERADGRRYRELRLPRREALIVTARYSAPLRAKIVDRLEELEAQQRSGVLTGMAMETILAAVAARLDRMIDDRLSRDPRAAGITSRSVREILDEAKVPSKGRRSLIRRACHSIKNHCLARGIVAHRCPRTNTWLWPEETITAWLEESGRSMITDHMAKISGQQVLPFRKPTEA